MAGDVRVNRAGRPRREDAAVAAPAAPATTFRFDGWYSLLTGLGTRARDKRESMVFQPDLLDWATAENVWRGDDLAARIIETLPNEMMREGYDLCIVDNEADDGVGPDGDAEVDSPNAKVVGEVAALRKMAGRTDPDLKKEVEHQWQELGLMDAIRQALYYERAYGGAAILIGANDGSADLEQPLAVANVRSVDFLTTLEPREIQPCAWYGDPRAKKFGEPAIFSLTTNSPGLSVGRVQSFAATVRIHESRLVIFKGVRVTRRVNALNGGWGDSIMTRVYRVLRDYNLAWGAAGVLVCDFAQAVYKMKGLNDLLQDDSKDVFKNRALGMEMARSVANVTMLDSEDEFTRIVTPVNGLADLLDRFTQRLCMAARLPLPLLASESPAGLNASGASGDQLRMFYDSARSEQKQRVVPVIRRVSSLIMQVLGGEPAQWTIEPRPLWQPTQKEQIETRKAQAEIDWGYLDRSVYSGREVRDSRFGGAAYSFDTKLAAQPESAEPTPDEVAEYAAEQAAAKGKPGAPPAPVSAGVVVPPGSAGGTPAAPATGGGELGIQQQVMNGAQIAAMAALIAQVVQKEIPIDTAQVMLEIGFQLRPQDAARMLAPVRNFEAPRPAPVPDALEAPRSIPAPATGLEVK